MTPPPIFDSFAPSRESAFAELALCEHYCRCARLHLEVADDAVTIMDLLAARGHFVAALRAFAPVKEAMIARGQPGAAEK